MKKPIVLLGVLVALVVFALIYQKVLDRRLSSSSLAKAEGRVLLLPNIPADKVRKILVRDSTGKVTLSVSGDNWTVEERSGYPASVEKIRRAVEALESSKIKDRKEVGKTALAKMKVLAPDEQAGAGAGLQIQFMDEKGDVLAGVVLGESPKSSGGANNGNFMGGPAPQRFARTPNDKDTVWLVEDSFSDIQADAKSWLDTSWPTISDVKSVAVTHANAPDSWKAERKSEDSAFVFVGAPAGEELDTAKADGLTTRVLEGPLTDVLAKDKVTADLMKGATQVKLATFAGFTYDIELLEKKAKEGESEGFSSYYVRFKVSADLPKERKAAADEKPEDKKKLDDEFVAKNKKLTEQLATEKAMEGWVFELSQYAVNSLVKKKSEIQRQKGPATPVTPGGAAGLPPSLAPPSIAPVPPPPPAPGTPPSMLQRPEPAAPAPAPGSAPTPPKPDEGKPGETKPAPAKPAEAPPAPPAKPADAPAATPPAPMPPAAPAKPPEAPPAPAPTKPAEPAPAVTPASAPAPAPPKPAEPAPAATPTPPAPAPAPPKPADTPPAKPVEAAPAATAPPKPAEAAPTPAAPPAKPAEAAPAPAPATDKPADAKPPTEAPAAAPKPAEEKPAEAKPPQ